MLVCRSALERGQMKLKLTTQVSLWSPRLQLKSLIFLFYGTVVKKYPRLYFKNNRLYLQYNSAAHNSSGDVFLFISHTFILTQLTIQMSVNVGQHWSDRTASDMQYVLAADDHEGQQHEAEQQLCHQCPHSVAVAVSQALRNTLQQRDEVQRFGGRMLSSPSFRLPLYPQLSFKESRQFLIWAYSFLCHFHIQLCWECGWV